MILTFETVLQEDFDPETRSAWTLLYATASRAMLTASPHSGRSAAASSQRRVA